MKETPVESRPGEALVWTDGACSGNPGPGGWAAIVIAPGGGDPVELSGGEPDTTNNRMELTAALEGLRSLPDASSACIVTDSQLMLNSMTTWLPGWKRKGWKTAAGKPEMAQQWYSRVLDKDAHNTAAADKLKALGLERSVVTPAAACT